MRRFQKVVALLLAGAGTTVVLAYAPARNGGLVVACQVRPETQPGAGSSSFVPRKSIVHHYPYPYPGYYHGDQTAGYRNPGSQGRYLEYYPPGNQFQENKDPVRPARFDQGFGNRSEQLASQQVGIARYNSIQGHIDNYARPMMGVGFFGGFY